MKKQDLFLVFIVVLSATVLILGMNICMQSGEVVVIMSNGTEYARASLSEDCEISVHGKNKVKIKNHKVYVSYADCPDKLCEKQGEISTSGKSLVCLPNKMTVTIEKNKKEFNKFDLFLEEER